MTTVEVAIESGHMWAEYSAALATLVAATGAGVIAWRSITNRKRADIKAEWWKRVQYAIEQCFNSDPRRVNIGLEMITVLGTAHPAGSRIEEPHHWSVGWLLPARGKSAWVADKDDRTLLSGLLDSIVDAALENFEPPDEDSGEEDQG